MDYCLPCRRHLNGALACPGCGAPVEELRAHAGETAGPERNDSRPQGSSYGDDAEGAVGRESADADDTDEGHDDEDGDDDAPVGRAARRAQGRGRGRGSRAAEGPAGGASRRDRKAAAPRRR